MHMAGMAMPHLPCLGVGLGKAGLMTDDSIKAWADAIGETNHHIGIDPNIRLISHAGGLGGVLAVG